MTGSSATLTTLPALGVWFLGLSLLIQIVQELYKHLTSSKSRAYSMTLVDFAGPFAKQLFQANGAPELTIRGPFQFRRTRPHGRLLPLKKEALVMALDRTAPVWHRLTREALELETELDLGSRKERVSATFIDFLRRLIRGTEEEPGEFEAREMAEFLRERGLLEREKETQSTGEPSNVPQRQYRLKFVVPDKLRFDPREILTEFRLKYSPQTVRVEEHFDQLMENYEYSYRRRNLRQTFVLALMLALWCDFAFDSLYARAASTTGPAAFSTAENIQGFAGNVAPASSSGALQQISYLPHARFRNLLRGIASVVSHPASHNALGWLEEMSYYLFGCVITAILICFGAPFWNDLTKSLLRIGKGGGVKEPEDN